MRRDFYLPVVCIRVILGLLFMDFRVIKFVAGVKAIFIFVFVLDSVIFKKIF